MKSALPCLHVKMQSVYMGVEIKKVSILSRKGSLLMAFHYSIIFPPIYRSIKGWKIMYHFKRKMNCLWKVFKHCFGPLYWTRGLILNKVTQMWMQGNHWLLSQIVIMIIQNQQNRVKLYSYVLCYILDLRINLFKL